jgi:hypothetical protein
MIVIVFASSCSCSSWTQKMTIEVVILVSFVFGLHRSCEKQATTTTIYDHHSLCLLLLFLLSFISNMKMTTQSRRHCTFFVLAFVIPMKDRRRRCSMIIIIFSSSCFHSFQTWRWWQKLEYLCLLIFAFITPVKDKRKWQSNHRHLRLLLPLSLFSNTKIIVLCHHLCVFFFLTFITPLKDKKWRRSQIVVIFISSCSHSFKTQKMITKVVVFVSFVFCFHRSYERHVTITMICDHHWFHLLLFLFLSNTKTTTQSRHLCVFFILAFVTLMKDKRQWQFMIIVKGVGCVHDFKWIWHLG